VVRAAVGVAEESGVGVGIVGVADGVAGGAAGVVPGVAVPPLAGLVGGEDAGHEDEDEPVVVVAAVAVVAVDEGGVAGGAGCEPGVGVAECARVVPAVDDAQGQAQVEEEPRRGVAAAGPGVDAAEVGVEAAQVSEDYVDDARGKAREWEVVA